VVQAGEEDMDVIRQLHQKKVEHESIDRREHGDKPQVNVV
jgi:hypothetical protein